jgi:hypothetical protein
MERLEFAGDDRGKPEDLHADLSKFAEDRPARVDRVEKLVSALSFRDNTALFEAGKHGPSRTDSCVSGSEAIRRAGIPISSPCLMTILIPAGSPRDLR